jgi:hypothetical protein
VFVPLEITTADRPSTFLLQRLLGVLTGQDAVVVGSAPRGR